MVRIPQIATPALFACLVACGSAKTSEDVAPDASTEDGSASMSGDQRPPTSNNEFAVRISQEICARFDRCDSFVVESIFPREKCQEVYEGIYSRVLTEVTAGLAKGRVSYDADRAQRCLAAIQDATCTDDDAGDLLCESVFVGTRAAGEGCYIDQECASKYCQTGGSASCGVCAKLREPGESCQDGIDRCASGLECRNDTCQPLKRLNEACTFGEDCASGLRCVGTLDSKTCQAPRQQNETCEADDFEAPSCAVELSCVAEAGSGMSFCEAPSYQPIGAACDEETRKCRAYEARCSGGAEKTCVALPTRGERCGGEDATTCAFPLRCSGSTSSAGTCEPKVGRSGQCARDADCESPYSCLSGTCLLRPFITCN